MRFDRDKFAANLRAERARKRLTQEQLAERSGVSVASVQNYERGATGVTQESACALADALGVTPNDLIGWE